MRRGAATLEKPTLPNTIATSGGAYYIRGELITVLWLPDFGYSREQEYMQMTMNQGVLRTQGGSGTIRREHEDQPEAPGAHWALRSQILAGWKWFDRLDAVAALKPGWNGYSAPAPDESAVWAASRFLAVLYDVNYPPTRLAPSAVGGIAITRRHGPKMAFVEFYNDGRVYALFEESGTDPNVSGIVATEAGFRRLVNEIKAYLNE